jgi:hypothetical protein
MLQSDKTLLRSLHTSATVAHECCSGRAHGTGSQQASSGISGPSGASGGSALTRSDWPEKESMQGHLDPRQQRADTLCTVLYLFQHRSPPGSSATLLNTARLSLGSVRAATRLASPGSDRRPIWEVRSPCMQGQAGRGWEGAAGGGLLHPTALWRQPISTWGAWQGAPASIDTCSACHELPSWPDASPCSLLRITLQEKLTEAAGAGTNAAGTWPRRPSCRPRRPPQVIYLPLAACSEGQQTAQAAPSLPPPPLPCCWGKPRRPRAWRVRAGPSKYLDRAPFGQQVPWGRGCLAIQGGNVGHGGAASPHMPSHAWPTPLTLTQGAVGCMA